MKVWEAANPITKETLRHAAFITGELGKRALLHADPLGVRYSSDYLENYYNREGYTDIKVEYYRRVE